MSPLAPESREERRLIVVAFGGVAGDAARSPVGLLKEARIGADAGRGVIDALRCGRSALELAVVAERVIDEEGFGSLFPPVGVAALTRRASTFVFGALLLSLVKFTAATLDESRATRLATRTKGRARHIRTFLSRR